MAYLLLIPNEISFSSKVIPDFEQKGKTKVNDNRRAESYKGSVDKKKPDEVGG